ncbi:UNVERIFIED_CONTAM: hypothetical protein PYX00_002601 [Menopon gallinae]|uniref:Reverse transcriptase domain-containing protein n=1 Tax=Menopon gallinae TaxID=328185 RepID=A0AAW2IIB3_9NEOP
MTDRGPWGRPYKILTNKIRPAHRSITETLEENLLRETINQMNLERRLTEFLEERRTNRDMQCGFPRGKSTIDATPELEKSIDKEKAERAVAIAVRIDIANVFNSIPWREIREAFRQKGAPE